VVTLVVEVPVTEVIVGLTPIQFPQHDNYVSIYAVTNLGRILKLTQDGWMVSKMTSPLPPLD
jgi:hypothetical protein